MLQNQGIIKIEKHKKKRRRKVTTSKPTHLSETDTQIPTKEPQKPEFPSPEKVGEIEWQAPAFEFREKTPDWYWSLGLLTVAIFIATIVVHNFLFGFIVLLSGFSLALYGAKKPETVTFKIDSEGIKIGNKIYDYKNLKCFWIDSHPPYRNNILIESKKPLMPQLTMPLGNVDQKKIKEFLTRFIGEKEINEPIAITLARIIGF